MDKWSGGAPAVGTSTVPWNTLAMTDVARHEDEMKEGEA